MVKNEDAKILKILLFLLGVASPPAPDYKFAAGSHVVAKLQKELPPCQKSLSPKIYIQKNLVTLHSNLKRLMSFDEILMKAKKYCAYQERTPFEVVRKFSSLELSSEQLDKIIFQLKTEDFINEERYVNLFVRGKLYDKKWGPRKIQNHLLLKGISKELIQKELAQINPNIVLDQLDKVISKWQQLNGSPKTNLPKLYRFLLSKGYDYEHIKNKLEQYK